MLGRGTTVIAEDGNLGDYLASLDRLRALADAAAAAHAAARPRAVAGRPGRGAGLLHRAPRSERLAEMRAALAAGDRTPEQIVARVYPDVDRSLWPFAAWSVRAQLGYLDGQARTAPRGQH